MLTYALADIVFGRRQWDGRIIGGKKTRVFGIALVFDVMKKILLNFKLSQKICGSFFVPHYVLLNFKIYFSYHSPVD